MARTPIRETPTRAMPDATTGIDAKPKKSRIRKNASQRSMLDLPVEVIEKLRVDYGADLQWVTDSVLGKAEPAMRQDFEINAWEPVTQDMFDGALDGMYLRKGQPGEIQYNGLILMWRPYELTQEARAEEQSARVGQLRAQENMIKGGQAIQGLSSGFEADHATALRGNKLTRSIQPPMEIPAD